MSSPTPYLDSKHDAACKYIRWNFWLRGLRPYDTKRCAHCRKLKNFRKER